ncbi:MAG TPA: ATP-binding protein [Chloroflexota bacterium]|nr:ATP-binding protein [Chloroflexota bacterium]
MNERLPHLDVLLVEDNPGDARLIREMLNDVPAARLRLRQADRLATGLEQLDGADVVLLDLSLPDSQGLETFRRLRDRAPEMPIVVLTGLDDETVAMRAVQEGAQDYLPKGQVDGQVLVRSMRYAIERKRAEEERERLLLREQAARAEAERLAKERAAILGHIADAVLIVDPSGRITFVNQAARRLHGVPPDVEFVNGVVGNYELLTADGRPYPPDERPLARAALRGETVIDAELRIRRADGSEVVALGSATPVVAEDGTRLGAVLTLHDVTAQRALERQKDEFLANVSHDLRTPLAGIKASIGVVLANEPAGTPEPLHRMFVNIDLAADRMGSLVDDLLELARFRAGRVGLQRQRTDLRALAERVAGVVEPLAAARGQQLTLALPAAPLYASADPDRLERVLLNLLGNAQKYGHDGGRISLRLERRGDEALWAVADDGPGIPLADQPYVFERFYRSESEATQRNQGSGLGLPIARAIVELHGGRIWVESVPGAGATFYVALPLTPTQSSSPGVQGGSPAGGPGGCPPNLPMPPSSGGAWVPPTLSTHSSLPTGKEGDA